METGKSLDVNFGEHLRTSNGDVHGKFIWDFKEIIADGEPRELLSIPYTK